MDIQLPPKTRLMVEKYIKLKIGKYEINTPYFENFVRKKRIKRVFAGKGTPEEIQKTAINLFKSHGKNLYDFDPYQIRHYMLMASIGIDCSGFATNIIDTFLKEIYLGSIKKSLRPLKSSLFSYFRHHIRTYTNLSANTLTSLVNCIIIKDINRVLPGDFIRFGPSHIAIISSVDKFGNKVKKITYYHSTCDYFEQHGVRKGEIVITNSNKNLENQKWTEILRGKNWSYQDYMSSESGERGIRRLKSISSKYPQELLEKLIVNFS
ncbi:MAG: hypothetical protein ACD_57C00027G0004 [uncultured bacterium]|uniref:NlpC/P60 domain-containing protein n=1 Tax=Candidatus Woesebacteria bacterium RIFCSPLOWO2_01_FULL_39_21 TaxID=1802519 RepID=A0A1F8BF70_9BACT|nr:MAG: hypothetical protein ACD_57C00027G0004 [uncultured bacterium]OGM22523.1 MAG: hypothetical protein A2691_04635 [Candidatus Woesebacteria bacterium RIFCSPHIGHO2_01_FULL_39_23]OGM61968.1 MAG: hypothetical protein A2961_02800 [Candidatus Woesebacteria bacterium RIFCSPLOWO2_01_FULL_39_21]